MRDDAAMRAEGAVASAPPQPAVVRSPKDRLIEAAMELVAGSGGQPVSTRQITEKAGVTAPTLAGMAVFSAGAAAVVICSSE